MKIDLYEAVTAKVLEKLEQGVVPWQKPWNSKVGAPMNIATGKPYNGINVMMLGSQGYDSKYWMTFKQCLDKGGHIKKGEKGSMVVFWSFIDKNGKAVDDDASPTLSSDKDKIPILRYYTVFNANQTEGLDLKKLTEELEAKNLAEKDVITPADQIVDAFVDRPEIKHGFTRACYRPSSDEVNLPRMEAFKTSEEYYSTLFHELVHSTGHEKRLGRHSPEMTVFGDEDYSKEELVAEMGAAFLSAEAGIESTMNNTASYIASWMKALQDDKRLLITAAGQAQKAAKYISEGLGSTKTVELTTPDQDIDNAVAAGRIPKELVDTLRGPNFEYTGAELLPVITSIAESPYSSALAGYVVSGTINTRVSLEAAIGPTKSSLSKTQKTSL